MIERTIEDRLRDLEAQNMAYGIVLRLLISSVWTREERAKERDIGCLAVEAAFTDTTITVEDHDGLHRAIHEIEELFYDSRAAPQPNPEDSQP